LTIYVHASFSLPFVPVKEHPEQASQEPNGGAGKRGGFASEVGDALPQGVVDSFDFAGFFLAPSPGTQLHGRRSKELFINRIRIGEHQTPLPRRGHLLPQLFGIVEGSAPDVQANHLQIAP